MNINRIKYSYTFNMQKSFIQSLFGSVIKPILFFLVNLDDQCDYPAFLPLSYRNFVTCVQKSAGRQMSVVNQRINLDWCT